MNVPRCFSRTFAAIATVGVVWLAGGCANVLVPKHKVMVDAIAAPGVAKPTGLSYRLVARKSVVNQAPAHVAVVKACVDAALTSQGMFDAPSNVPPDVFIEVGYGVESSPRADPAARETFLQLSARSNPQRAIERATGPEMWDVRVGVLGVAGRMETAMPLLCSVASSYIATDTKMETKVEIPENAPEVKAIREIAIRSLERPAPLPPAEPPASSGAANPPAAASSSAATR